MALSSPTKNTQPVNRPTPSSRGTKIQHSSISSENRLAREILWFSTKVKSERGPPQVYKLPMVSRAVTAEKSVVMCEVGKPNVDHWRDSQRVVMVVGTTGARKMTLINGMANYIFGVEWKDDFRFKVVTDEDEGGKGHVSTGTKHITAYHFPRQRGANVPYGLTVIDTPGFGNTGGVEEDQRTMAQIKDFFLNPDGITQLDGIGFVTQSSQGRLTPTQQYMFDSILSIFGKDIGDIIFMMTTFADAHRPPILYAVDQAGIKYGAAFKFNTSALFVDNNQLQGDENFDEMFWKMGMRSFQSFFSCIGTVQTKSLQLTRKVLLEQELLHNLVQGLRPQIQLGLTKIDEFHQEERIVKEHEAEILKSEDFKYEVKVQKQRIIDLKGKGIYTTNCLQCNFTCHSNCPFANDEDKIRCCAMKNGYCTVCPKKCKWDQHKNTPYHYEWYTDVETRTSEDLLRRYNIATSDRSKVEALMASLENDLKKLNQIVLQMAQQTKHCLHRLNDIALKPNPLSTVEYIDTLIEAEKVQSDKGFRERIQALKELRKEAELLSTMSQTQVDKYMKADHKTFFQQFQPPPVKPKPQPRFMQKFTGYFTGN